MSRGAGTGVSIYLRRKQTAPTDARAGGGEYMWSGGALGASGERS